MKRIIYLVTFFILLSISFTVNADPVVSFTATSTESKTILTPVINSDVTHYKWSIIGKRGAYDLETGWIPYADRADHISMLETGTYFVTIIGRNTDTGLTARFTNEVKVSVKEDYVKPKKEVIEEDIGSLIINNLPEPLKSFFKARSNFELLIIVLGTLLLIGITTRRKKVSKYIKLEEYHGK